ncbi:MAG TPA: replication initiation factor domain-containing protein [Candidatus Angelobacter sp.]|nr:replication initiation factor domain-containing protein [Candidatus Angelobacter sp.]
MQNYKVMRVFPSGMTSHHGHNKSDKWLNVATGGVCDRIQDQLSYIQNVLNEGAEFSRIDYCCTVESGVSVDDFRLWCKDGKVSGVLAENGIKSIVNDSSQVSETTYIGNLKERAKKGIFRAYDKAVELGIEDFKLTRFELEERKKRAQITAKRYADGMEIGDIIQQRVNVDVEAWRDIMGKKSEVLKRYTPDEKLEEIDNTWHWLIQTCAKTLGEKIAEDMYNGLADGNLDLFNKMVEIAYTHKKRQIEQLTYREWNSENETE